jgi:phospholipid N-methyltransferase
MNSSVKDLIRFFHSFVQSPQKVGSIIPSSTFAAREMFRSIALKETTTIIELGAGTGVFTKYIAEEMPAKSLRLIFEQNDQLRKHLEEKYPNLHFYENALNMVKVLEELGVQQVDAVVCALPFVNFPQETREELTYAIHKILKPNGTMVAIQFSRQMKDLLTTVFKDVSISFVPFNFPPAFVFTCNKIDQ